MKRFWLKIAGAVVLAAAAIVAVIVFWPSQTPIIESRDAKQIQKQGKPDFQAPPEMLRSDASAPERHPDDVETSKSLRELPKQSQKISHFIDEQMSLKYPGGKQYNVAEKRMSSQYLDSLQSNEPRETLPEPLEWGQKPYKATNKEMSFRPPSGLKSEKSVERPRPSLPEAAGFKLPKAQAEKMYQKTMSHILEMYSNGRQREKVIELLLKTLRHRPEQYNATREKMIPRYLDRLKAGRARQLQLRDKAPFQRYTKRDNIIDKKMSTQYLNRSGDKTKGLALKDPNWRQEQRDVTDEEKALSD
ncbi:hypothetical protein ES703_33372 [subsurface metagenome]